MNKVQTAQAELSGKGNLEKLEGLLDAAIDSATPSVVQRVAATGAQLMEIADILNTPETLELLREVAGISRSLTELLKELEKIQASGVLSTLFELSGLIKTAKDSMTASVATGTLATGVRAFAVVDEMVQLEGDKFLSAFLRAAYESKAAIEAEGFPRDKPVTLRDLAHLLKDREIRKSIWLLLKVMQKLPKHLEE